MEARSKPEMLIKDRPELARKPKPLTLKIDATAGDAVAAMCDRGVGSIIIVDEDRRPIGIFTERDVMLRLVKPRRDPDATPIEEVMTRDVRVARETDDLYEWLREMSNERFRRLPIVDGDGRIQAVMTQGDFVSYTWPELLYQGGQLFRATLSRNFYIALILGALILYAILVALVVT